MEKQNLQTIFNYSILGAEDDTYIFKALENVGGDNLPWINDKSAADLDAGYMVRSGIKWCAPVFRLLPGIADGLTIEHANTIARIIISQFLDKWKKEWAVWSLIYDPIENYNMREQMTDDERVTSYGKTSTRTDNLTHAHTATETNTKDLTNTETKDLADSETKDLTETTTPNLTTNETNTINGFNSASGVESGGKVTTQTGTQIVTNVGTDTTRTTGTDTMRSTGTDTVASTGTTTDSGTVTSADGGSDTERRNYTLTRSGNIGVTTSQQMIESEKSLWIDDYFNSIVYPDIDKILTLSVY